MEAECAARDEGRQLGPGPKSAIMRDAPRTGPWHRPLDLVRRSAAVDRDRAGDGRLPRRVWIVDRAHPATRVPRWRIAAWLAGVAAIGLRSSPRSTCTPEASSACTWSSTCCWRWWPHPCWPSARPVTLVLRAATPGLRRSVLIPLLHSRPSRRSPGHRSAGSVFTVVDVGDPLQPALQRRPRERGAPFGRAPALPGCRPALLVAGDRRRPRSLAAAPDRPDGLPGRADAVQHGRWAGDLLRARASCTLTTHPSAGPGAPIRSPISSSPESSCGGSATSSCWAHSSLAIEAWLRADEKRSRRTRERAANVDRASVEGH